MKWVLAFIFLISIILSLSFFGIENKEFEKGEASIVIATIGNTTTENIIVNGEKIIEVIGKTHDIEGKIRCIDGICNSGDYYWQIYVNEERLNDISYIPNKNDTIKLEFSN